MGVRSYIQLSEKASKISEVYTNPEDFVETYLGLNPLERKSFLSYYIVDNNPFIFKEIPLLYQQIIQCLSEELDIRNSEIKLIGSAKTGFSISPKTTYGKPFSESSDLDFTIFNKPLFEKLEEEFNLWSSLFKSGDIKPSKRESKFWTDNLNVVPRNINKGFIDTYKIPNREPFPLTKKINNILYLIPFKLNEIHGIENHKASLRVYYEESSFLRQLKLNTEYILNGL